MPANIVDVDSINAKYQSYLNSFLVIKQMVPYVLIGAGCLALFFMLRK
jgi:hypothetical protein